MNINPLRAFTIINLFTISVTTVIQLPCYAIVYLYIAINILKETLGKNKFVFGKYIFE